MRTVTERGIKTAIDEYQRTLTRTLIRDATRAHIAGDIKAHKALSIAVSFDLVQKEALAYSKEYGKLLYREGATIIKGKKVPWLRDSTGRTRENVFKIIRDGLKEGKPVAQIGGKRIASGTIAHDLQNTLIRERDFEYVRIARTEVARIQSAGSMTRYKANGVKKFKWLCGGDPCPICAQYCNRIFSVEELPEIPVHPNCTCDKAPVISREKREELRKKKPAVERPVKPKEKVPKKTSTPETVKEKTRTIETDTKGITKKLDSHRVDNLKLTNAEAIAADEYKDVGYMSINNGLRGKQKMTKEIQSYVKGLDSSLSKSKVPDDINVFRGISAKQAKLLKETNVCSNSGYTSTTYNPKNAFTFATRGEDKYFNLMEFKVKKGTKALMWPGGENEIMLERGLKLKCTGIKEVTNFAAKTGKAAADKTKKVRIFIMEVI